MRKVPRVIRTGHDGAKLYELNPSKLTGLVRISEVNGENALVVTTLQTLTKGDVLLCRDGRGYWHEYVVEGDEASHENTATALHEYYCPWSLQHDLMGTCVSGMPGTGGTPATATQALTAALAGTARWTVGTVNVTKTGSASFWNHSGWDALAELVNVWGGEVQERITVGLTGVTARAVDLLEHVGSSTATRRFDYSADLRSIRRIVHDQLWTSRVKPLGAGEETDSGGYGRKITIESVNSGVDYLSDSSAEQYTRIPTGNGGWEYPIQIVENPDCETPAELKAWAQEHLSEWTTPKVTYEADVISLTSAGLSALGVGLGDEVVCVDRSFGNDPLRIQGRVLRIEEDLLDPTQTVLTISNFADTLADTLNNLASATSTVYDMVTGMSANQSSVEWVSDLLARINAEANSTGGYTYITEGQGIRCYNAAVSDPLVGTEASAVCEVKGGTMRIANTKDSQGNWEWKTVFTSGRILAELIDAIGASSGYHAQLTPTGLDVYDGANLTAHFGSEAEFYDGSGNKLLTIGAYSQTYHEGQLDFGSTIGTIGGAYNSARQYNQMLIKAINQMMLQGPDIDIFASGIDSNQYGYSPLGAGAQLRAQRAWTGSTTRLDKASFAATVNQGGQAPRAIMSAESWETTARLMLRADGNSDHGYLDMVCDRIQITDDTSGLEPTYHSIYPTSGSLAQDVTVPAGGSVTRSISFGHTYESAPVVTATLYSTSTAAGIGKLSYVMSEITTTGAKVKIFNADTTDRMPGVRWIAIG